MSISIPVFEDVPFSGLIFMQNNLHITVTSLIAAAVVWMSEFPTRLNPIILPLMASIKREQVAIEIKCSFLCTLN